MSPDGFIAMKVAVRVAKAAIEAAPPKSENETDDAYQEIKRGEVLLGL